MNTRLPFLLLALGLVFGAIASRGDLLLAFQLPGLAFVVALTLLGLLASFGPGVVLGAAIDVIRHDATHRERTLHVRVWQRAHRLAWVAGGLAALCSVVLLLSNLSDPDAFFPSFAVCFLPLFWSVILAELMFSPLSSWAERANQEQLVPATQTGK